ncbi:MAG: hypothetical protein GC157_01185 [Frankiales bacterium]|nr:hypothetical protein [Frankiales bacterium]
MTLIAFYANRDFAVVAADRRVTLPDGTIKEDSYTKLLTWDGGLVFGLTGAAYLNVSGQQVRSIDWLAKDLAASALAGSARRLDLAAVTKRLNRVALRNPRRKLAFAGIGFLDRRPTLALISNMHMADGTIRSHPARLFVATSLQDYHEEFFTLGVPPSQASLDLLHKAIPKVRSNPMAVAQVLVGFIKRSSGPVVGQECLVVWLHSDATVDDAFYCDVLGPGIRPGALVNFAMPVGVMGSGVSHIHPQPLRRSRRRRD